MWFYGSFYLYMNGNEVFSIVCTHLHTNKINAHRTSKRKMTKFVQRELWRMMYCDVVSQFFIVVAIALTTYKLLLEWNWNCLLTVTVQHHSITCRGFKNNGHFFYLNFQFQEHKLIFLTFVKRWILRFCV